MKIYNNVHNAYLGTLEDVLANPEYKSSPRGQKTLEKLDYSFRVLKPTMDAIITKDEERNKVIKKYSDKEFELYNSMTNDVNEFAKASKFWKKLANPDGTINSAYGYLIWGNKSHGNPEFECDNFRTDFLETYDNTAEAHNRLFECRLKAKRTPWEWAKTSLLNDKDTRQAILRFSLPEHQYLGNKDQTCTLHGNFLIREDRLNLSITMRSNDLMKGLVFDLPWFVSLMYKMVDELKETYPNLEVGHYTHFVHSCHIYERDIKAIEKMIGYDQILGD